MRLIELRVSNFQRVRAVAIRPDGHLVTIAGRNDQGKTSLLQSIFVLLAGQAAAPPRPIRDGEEECRLYGDFGEIKVTRTFHRTEGGDVTMSLKVTEGDGKPISKKPQAFLDSLLGAFAFDPLAFAKAKSKEQFDLLKKLVPGIDFDAIAGQRKQLFEARTEINRKADQAKKAAGAIQLPPGSIPKEIDVSKKLAELEETNKRNAAIEPERLRRTAMAAEVQALRDAAQRSLNEAAELEKRVAALRTTAAQHGAAADAAEIDISKLPALPTPVDTAPINAEIARANEVKQTRARFAERVRLEDEAEENDAQAAELTRQIEHLDQQKIAAVAAAKMPVKGLGFGEDEILLNGIPFVQAGTRVKIMTSAMIGMALNPKLRVMTIDEGSELDQDGLALLEKLATENDYTVIIAKVDERGANGLVMEDGSLVPVMEAAE
jgi:hypothetical protein